MSDLGNLRSGAGYVSSKTAASSFGVTTDYIARLCKSGKLRGVMEGRVWMVETSSLRDFFGKDLPGAIEQPVKIYYKDTPTIEVPRPIVSTISRNPAVIAICPPEFRPRVSYALVPRPIALIAVRTVILGVLVLGVGAMGYGSINAVNTPIVARFNQVAAAETSGFVRGVTQFLYNLFNRDASDAPAQIAQTVTPTPVSAPSQPVQKPVQQRVEQPVQRQPQKVAQTIINNPVIERIVERERVVSSGGVSEVFLNTKLDALDNQLRSLIFASSASASAGTSAVYNVVTQTNRIDTLASVDISDSVFSNGRIVNSSFENASFSSLSLSGTTTSTGGFNIADGCYAVDGVCITGGGSATPGGASGNVQFNDNGALSGVATFSFSTSSDRLVLTNASTTNLSIGGGITGAGLASCSGSLDKIQYDSTTRQFVCATDQTGGGGGSDTNWSFFNTSGLRPATTTNQVLIGGIATTSNAKLQVIGGAQIDNATSSAINTNLLGIGGASYFSSLTGNGLTNAGGTLTVHQGQAFSTTSVAYWDSTQARWATTSTDYWKSQTNFYSTSSADFWKTQNNFFSTTSASAFLALNQGNAFSTSSVAYFAANGLAFSTTSSTYFLSQNQALAFATSSASYNLSTYDKGFFFSTTSVNYWEGTQNRWATTSAQYFLSQNQGLAFSTTSAAFYSSVGLAFSSTSASYFLSQNEDAAFSTTSANYYVNASTTIPKTYTSNTFTGTNTFGAISATGATTTSLSTGIASTSMLVISNLQNQLLSVGSTGNVISSAIVAPLSFSAGSLSIAVAGASQSGYVTSTDWNSFNSRLSTTTLALFDKGYFFSTTSSNYFTSIGLSFSTTSSDYWLITKSLSAFSTTSADYWKTQNNFHSTSSFAFNLSTYDNGSFFSTTSVNYWEGTQNRWATTSAQYFLSQNQGLAFSTTSASFFSASGLAYSTSSANFYSSVGLAFSTTSAQYFLSQNDSSFSTSSALFFASVGLAHSTTSVAFQLTQTPVMTNGFISQASSTLTGNLTTTGIINFNQLLGTTSILKLGNINLLTASSINANYSLGLGALRDQTTGIENTAVGDEALLRNTTGSGNTAFGDDALKYNISATSSTAVGKMAARGFTNYTGEGITAMGYGAGGLFMNNASYNTLYGYFAGGFIQGGQSNIMVGSNIGTSGNISSGSGNIGIANNALFPSGTGNNQLNIGNLIYGSLPATSTGFLLPTSGTIGIGTTSPTSKFGIAINAGDTLTTLFQISSSTSNSTTTLFSIGNTGSTTAANGFNISNGCYAVNGTCLTPGAADGTFSTTSASYFSSLGLAFSTTSTDYWKTQNNFFSTTSALFFSSVGLAHSTTSVAYQLTQTPVMTNGLLAYASSTIGNGTATGGLTISGGATTTGNAFFGGFINATSTLGTTTFFTLGGQSFITATSGPRNTGVGYGALASHISGSSDNTAFGYGALSRSLSGSSNTAIGSWTLLNATTTTSSDNTAVGRFALRGDPNAGLTGANNTAIGSSALLSISTGSHNVAIGYSTMPFVARGSRNTVIGSSAGSTGGQDTTGGDNVFVGYLAGSNVQGGYANILVGANTTFGNTIVNGAGNVGVGNNLRFASDTNNQLNIGNLIFGSLPATSTGWVLPTSGTVGIGTTSPTSKFGIAANNGDTLTTLFQISSSTANSTSTLFSINNRGQVLIGGSAATTSTLGIGQMAVLPSTTTIVRIATTTQTGTGFGKAIQGSYLYIAGFATTNGFEIFDISNPTLPTRVGQASFTNSGVGVAVQGRYAYTVENAAQDTFKIWDISNPASPVMLSQSSMTQTAASIKVSGNYAYLVSGNSGVNFEIWDVSNPTAPKRVSANSLSSFGRNVVVQGRYAYFANNASSFEIWDVANPAAPIRMSLNVLNANGRAIHVQGRYAYLVGSGGNNSFEIWDVSNPAAPVRSSINTIASSGSGGQDVYVQGRYAYVTGFCCTKNFEVWDVSSTTAAFRVALNNTSNTPNIIVQGRYAYLTNTTLEVWDLGGAYVSQFEAGGIETGTLAVRNNFSAMDGMFQGGLNIVNSLNVGGTFALNAFNNSTTTAGQNYSIFSVGTASSTAITGNSTTSIPFLNISYNGNIGVGTTSNLAKFAVQNNYGSTNTNLFEISSSTSVDGNAQSSLFSISRTGSTTAANGFNISNGCYAVNGTCLTSGGSSASTTLLSDTNLFSGVNMFSAGLLSLASTTIGNGTQIGGLTISGGATTTGNAYFAGNVNVASANTATALDVSGTITVGVATSTGRATLGSWTLGVTNNSFWMNMPTTAGSASGIGSGGAGVNAWIAYAGAAGNWFTNAALGDIAYRNQSGRILFGNTTGNSSMTLASDRYGFGTVANATTRVQIAGTTAIDPFEVASSTGSAVGQSYLRVTQAGNIGIGTSSPFAKLTVHANSGETNNVLFAIASSTTNSTTTLFTVTNSGYVGIGTSSPQQALHVVGQLAVEEPVYGRTATIQTVSNGVGGGVLTLSAQGTNGVVAEFTDCCNYILRIGGTDLESSFHYDLGVERNLRVSGAAGIGSSTPASKLAVQKVYGDTQASLFTIASSTSSDGASNTVLFSVGTTGSTTAANGFNISSGCYAVNGTCITSGGVASSTILSDANTWSSLATFSSGVRFSAIAGTSTFMTFGGQSLANASSTGSSTGFGLDALSSVTSGGNNAAFGSQALKVNTSGGSNSAFGSNALSANTTGNFNVAIGRSALAANTIGSRNVAIGSSALATATNTNDTIAIGYQAGWGFGGSDYNGNANTLVGVSAGYNAGTGMAHNTYVGFWAGAGTGAAYGNTILGANTTFGNSYTGNGSIGIGVNTYFSSSTASNQLNIGNLIFGSLPATSTAWALPTSGTIGIGTTSPISKFAIALNSGDTSPFAFLIASSTPNSTSTLFAIDRTGNIGIGTTTPYAKLSVVGNVVADTFYATSTSATSTFNGGLNVGSGAIVYDYSSGQTSIQNLALGSMSFDSDSGVVTWNDMPVTSVSSTGTPQSYHAAIDGTALLSLYSESDGSGGIKNIGVGIGSTTPWANLAVQKNFGDTKASVFTVGSSTLSDGSNANTFLTVSGTGFGTTTVSGLNVSGSATSTANVGFNITSGCYAINGVCLTSGGSSASSTLLSDSNTFSATTVFSSGNVGVGTTSPYGKLAISALAQQAGEIPLLNIASTTNASLFMVLGNGRVGIGTTTPIAALALPFGTTAVNGINFGGDTQANLYRSGAGVVMSDGELRATQFRAGSSMILSVGYITDTGPGTNFRAAPTAAGSFMLNIGANNADTHTSGVGGALRFAHSIFAGHQFQPSSGTGDWYGIYMQPLLNQSGTATGLTRGVYLALPPAAAYDYRSLEIATTTVSISNASAISNGYNVLVHPTTYTSSSTSLYTLANASTLNLAGAPIGTTASTTITNSTALLIQGNALTNVTNGTGLVVNAPTGATRNFAAQFLGGNVGVGTSTPFAPLSVASGTVSAFNGAICADDGGMAKCYGTLTPGVVYGDSSSFVASDVAEQYRSSDTTLRAGEIVTLDLSTSTTVKRAAMGDKPLGVVSTQPGVLLGDETPNSVPLALAGRVPLVVNNEGGAIRVGDSLSISSVAGVATKATTTTYTVGIALESFEGMGTSSILVFVQTGYTIQPNLLRSLSIESTSTPNEIAQQSFATSSNTLRSAIAALQDAIVRTFNAAIYATSGIFEKIFAKEVHTDRLCVADDSGETCITKAQLDALLAGAAASTPQNQPVVPPPAPAPEPEAQTPEHEEVVQGAPSNQPDILTPPADEILIPIDLPITTPEPEVTE